MRASGVLLHITSLPSQSGVGTLADVNRFIDFLRESKQQYWQLLPITPCDFVNSPYASPSAFAGNTLLIDADELAAEGLIDENTLLRSKTARGNDYGYAIYHKEIILREAFEAFNKRDPSKDLQSEFFLVRRLFAVLRLEKAFRRQVLARVGRRGNPSSKSVRYAKVQRSA